MRRHWSQRFLAVLVTSWFALLGLEPAAFHTCPTHGGAGGTHALHGVSMDAAMRSSTAEHDAAAGASHEHAPTKGGAHQCTCPGSCCGPSALTLASAPLSLGVGTLRVQSVRAAAPAFRAEWNDRLLPFATAPPVRA